jgi:hypothetical protein
VARKVPPPARTGAATGGGPGGLDGRAGAGGARGGKHLARTRHHLDEAGLSEQAWREQWAAARRFLQADGESGKRYGNETIRITPEGEISLKLPAPLAGLANAEHGRYVLSGRVRFGYRSEEWADRVAANRAVAYRIHFDVGRGRWYVTVRDTRLTMRPGNRTHSRSVFRNGARNTIGVRGSNGP